MRTFKSTQKCRKFKVIKEKFEGIEKRDFLVFLKLCLK